MWQEAKKQEKILRGIMVDYKQRAERRKGYYDKIKKDPAEFLQLWGRKSKIHIDPVIAQAADNPSIMTKWNGDEDSLIDRFDVRSHLDYLPEYRESKKYEADLTESERNEERMLNYERYRTLVQNEAVGITESQCLKQIEIDEKFGSTTTAPKKEEKKEPKAQIGYVYQDSTGFSNYSSFTANQRKPEQPVEPIKDDEDLDLALDTDQLTGEHKGILNKCATSFGMEYGDYIRMLILDDEEKEKIQMNKLLEAEKAQYSGRKSRRERRIVKERLRREKGDISPLSYVIAKSPEKCSSSSKSSSRSSSRSRTKRKSRFRSRSPSKYENESKKNKVIMITSFGGDEDEEESAISKNVNKTNLSQSQKSEIEEKLSNLKRLKQNAVTLRSRSNSRSRSSSPVQHKTTPVAFKKSFSSLKTADATAKVKAVESADSSSGGTESTDEEEKLKKYLERRETRKQITVGDEVNDSNELANKSSKEYKAALTNNATVSTDNNNYVSSLVDNPSSENGSLSTKFRSAEEFKQYKEKLKKKMQKQIDKQLKKDKVVEKSKRKKEREERREREAELNSISEKMRQRILAERKKNGCTSSESDRSRSRERSRSRTRRSRTRSRSRKRSGSRSRRRSGSRKRSRDRSLVRKSQRGHSRSKSRSHSRHYRSPNNRSRSRSRSRQGERYRSKYTRSRSRSRTRSSSRRRTNTVKSKIVKRSVSRSPRSNRSNHLPKASTRRRSPSTSSSSSSKSSNSVSSPIKSKSSSPSSSSSSN